MCDRIISQRYLNVLFVCVGLDCVAFAYPGGQNCASVAVFFLSNKSPNFVTQTLETWMKQRHKGEFELAMFVQTVSTHF